MVIWSGEDPRGTRSSPRLIASGADMRRVFFVMACARAMSLAASTGQGYRALEVAIEKAGGAALVVVDPVVPQ